MIQSVQLLRGRPTLIRVAKEKASGDQKGREHEAHDSPSDRKCIFYSNHLGPDGELQ